MQKCAFVLVLLLAISADASLIRAKRQFMGPPHPMGAFPPHPNNFGGPELTPAQAMVDRNLAIAQARSRQALINSQIATNQAVGRANFNAGMLAAESRANIAAANARIFGLGK